MKRFTEIGQFREVIRAIKSHHDYVGKDENEDPIYRHESAYPTIRFRGTVKLHGTNAAIVMYKDGHLEYQSRERVLSLKEDNASFMLSMMNIDTKKLFEGIEFNDHCAIYGEWCGGNITKGVAIAGLPKMWVIFAVKIDEVYQSIEEYAHLKMEDQKIYNTLQFEHYYQDIDFEKPEEAQNKLVELTLKVENQCPVGKYFVEQCTNIICEKIDGKLKYNKSIENLGIFKESIEKFIHKNIKNSENIIINVKISE
jgi:hypothetical protein